MTTSNTGCILLNYIETLNLWAASIAIVVLFLSSRIKTRSYETANHKPITAENKETNSQCTISLRRAP